MRALAIFFSIFFLAAACSKPVVEKPGNLIEEGKMVDIIYDLALLESIKSQKPIALEEHHVNPNTYIYTKYKIDSLQFAKSNQYYSADLKKYKKIYEKVATRLAETNKANDAAITKNGDQIPASNSDAPQVQ